MAVCVHYVYDDKEKKNISTVKRVRAHYYECKICKVKLHDVDVQNLNNWIHYLNSDDKYGLLKGREDVYEMLKPIPRNY